jgi:hypothetical protein
MSSKNVIEKLRTRITNVNLQWAIFIFLLASVAFLHNIDTSSFTLTGSYKQRYKVALVTASDYAPTEPGIGNTIASAIKEREAYAKKFGYTFDVIDLRTFKTNLPSDTVAPWKKIAVIQHIFKLRPEADWVWWLDMDAVLMDTYDLQDYVFDDLYRLQISARTIATRHASVGLPNLFHKVQQIPLHQANLIITPDMNQPRVNAGSFLLRRGSWTDILLDLWTDPTFLDATTNNTIGSFEQGVLSHLIFNYTSIAYRTALIPMRSINAFGFLPTTERHSDWMWSKGSMVMHMASCRWHSKCVDWDRQYRAIKAGKQKKFNG